MLSGVMERSTLGHGDVPKFSAINPDGTLKWSITTTASVVSAPGIASDGTAYVSASQHLHAIDPQGTTKWTHTAAGALSAPTIGADGTIYVGSFWRWGVERPSTRTANEGGA